MAENVVEILVKSRNDTKAGFSQAKNDAEIAGDEAGMGFAQRFISRMMMGLSGAGNSSGGAGGTAGFFETFGSQFGMLAAGALVAAPAIAAVVVEVDALASGIAAAGAGIGAFGILAYPTFEKVKNAYTAIGKAQTAYNLAVQKEKLDPTKANADAVSKALLNLKAVQDQAGPGTMQFVNGVHQLMGEFGKLSQKLQPTVLEVFNDALKAAGSFLPNLLPFAQAAGGAIDGLLKHVTTFFQSADFRKWLGKFLPLVGPAITAIGGGIGKVMTAVGNLFTRMSSKDVVHAINIVFDAIAGIINGLAKWITGAMNNWDRFSGAVKEAWANVKRWTQDAVHWLRGLPAWMKQIGENAISSFLAGLKSVPVIGTVVSIGESIVGGLKHILGIGSPSRVFRELGQNSTEGFRLGMLDRVTGVRAASSVLAASAAGGLAGLPAGSGAGGLAGLPAGSGAGGHPLQVVVQLEWAGSSDPLFTGLRQGIRVRGGLVKALGP